MKNTFRKGKPKKNAGAFFIGRTTSVLSASASDGNSKLLREAEKIVEKYMDKKGQRVKEEKKPPVALILSAGALIVSAGVLAFSYFV